LKEWIMKTRTLWTLGLLLVAAAPLAAQAPRARQRALAPEAALRHRSELQLTDAQVKQFRALREETIKNRQADMAARMELRSKLMAGEITRQEFRTQATERINAMETRREQRGDPARALLNDAQREKLQSLQQEMRQQRAARGRADFRARGRMDMRHGGMNMSRGRMDMRWGPGGGRARPGRPPAPPAPPDSN
jgi:hypothetical protein